MDDMSFKLLTLGVTVLGLLIGYVIHIDRRDRELAWKRTEFLFSEARQFDNDPDIAAAVMLLQRPGENLEPFFSATSVEGQQIRHGFEKMLNFFDRLAHSYFTLKTLDREECANFGWYLQQVCENPYLVNWCENNGYADVIRLQQEIS